jgi:hypothetical protein
MDAESDEPRAKRAKVQGQLDVFFNKPLVRERRYYFNHEVITLVHFQNNQPQ